MKFLAGLVLSLCLAGAALASSDPDCPSAITDQTPLNTLLSVRTRDILAEAGIETFGQLRKTPRVKLMAVPRIGGVALLEIAKLFDRRELPWHFSPVEARRLDPQSKWGRTSIDAYFSYMTCLILWQGRIRTLGELFWTPRDALMALKGFEAGELYEIASLFKRLGLRWHTMKNTARKMAEQE